MWSNREKSNIAIAILVVSLIVLLRANWRGGTTKKNKKEKKNIHIFKG
jgi:hypothetical protein